MQINKLSLKNIRLKAQPADNEEMKFLYEKKTYLGILKSKRSAASLAAKP